jgi:hypothetical protein
VTLEQKSGLKGLNSAFERPISTVSVGCLMPKLVIPVGSGPQR